MSSLVPRLAASASPQYLRWILAGLCLILLLLLLLLPRAAAPAGVPLPQIDFRAVSFERARDLELAGLTSALPFEVRAVGETFRQLNIVTRKGDKEEAVRMRFELLRLAQAALQAGLGDDLLRLRALQTRMVLAAIRQFADGAPAPSDLFELGGDFFEQAARSGWRNERQFYLCNDELWALFRVHWSEQTGLSGTLPFSPTLSEWQLHYRALLVLPAASEGGGPNTGPAGSAGTTPENRDEQRLRYVKALAQRDTNYPIEFATGVLLLRLGQAGGAVLAFDRFLEKNPNGRYQTLARHQRLYAISLAQNGT